MTSRDFAYWLQGFFEISTADAPLTSLRPDQVSMIQRHLALVFKHEIDPSIDGGKPEVAAALQAVHDSPVKPQPSRDQFYRC